jgi:hypothetical protein
LVKKTFSLYTCTFTDEEVRKLKDVLRKYDSKSVVSFLREAETICAEQISLTQMGGVPQKKTEIDTEKKKNAFALPEGKKRY